MTTIELQVPPIGDINVPIATDEISIYEKGNLTGVSVEDLLENEVAIRQLVNELNIAKRSATQLRNEIEGLKRERTGYSMQPWILAFIAAVNIIGMVLVGVGTNLLTSSAPPSVSSWIMAAGVILALLSAIGPVFLPKIIRDASGVVNAK